MDMYPEIRQLESISKPSVRAIKALLHGYGQEAAWIGIVIAQEIATDLGVTFSKTANDKQ